jgi:pimeloyl-ACP methyl ester carboxylesterase
MGAANTERKQNFAGIRMLRQNEVWLDPPSKWLLLMEARAGAEFAALLLSTPYFARLPRGDGHAVLVIPGFGATDRSTLPMRLLLKRLGYAAYGWQQGRNLGMRSAIKDYLGRRMEQLGDRHGGRISLIGWSLGGVYVREMARQSPQHVRQVITMGSPINGHPDANNVMTLFSLLHRNQNVNLDWDAFQRRRVPPPVPCTAIYSRSDGIVAWQCSREEPAPNTDNVEVFSSHFGLGVNPQALAVVADRLAQPADDWRRFEPPAWQQALLRGLRGGQP